MSDVASSRPNAKEVMLTFFPVNVEVVPYFSAHVILRIAWQFTRVGSRMYAKTLSFHFRDLDFVLNDLLNCS